MSFVHAAQAHERIMKRCLCTLLTALTLTMQLPALAETRVPYPQRTEVREFIDELTAKHGFERDRLER